MNGRGASAVQRSLAVPIHGVTFIGLAVLTSFFAYLWGATSPNPAELLAPGLFWYAVSFMLLAYPLRDAFQIFRRYIWTAFGAGVFALYLALHVVLYGFMLESILVSFFDRPFVSASASVYVTTSVFAPPSVLNAVYGLWFNPWVTITIPPSFSDALSFYSLDIAVIIAILIVANIGKTRELGKICSTRMKSRSMVIFPAVGIALGASCCLSVPIQRPDTDRGGGAHGCRAQLLPVALRRHLLPLPAIRRRPALPQPLLSGENRGQHQAVCRERRARARHSQHAASGLRPARSPCGPEVRLGAETMTRESVSALRHGTSLRVQRP
jgi:hypothetical protein